MARWPLLAWARCLTTSMHARTQARFRAAFSAESKPDTQGNGSPRTDFSVMDSPHVPQPSLEPHPVPMLSRRYVTGRTQLAGASVSSSPSAPELTGLPAGWVCAYCKATASK
jgi:hypothetical protein